MSRNEPGETVEQQRLRLLFRQARTASLIAALGALICLAVLLHASISLGALAWFAAVITATGLRFAMYRAFFSTQSGSHPVDYWLRRHFWSGALVGISWGSLPLVPISGVSVYVQQVQVLVPAFMVMAAVTSYGIYLRHYLMLLLSTGLTVLLSYLYAHGAMGAPVVILFAVFAPVLAVSAKRYGDMLLTSLHAQRKAQELVIELSRANNDLQQRNSMLARQQDMIQQEEALAQHVFRQLTLGGDHQIDGVHSWNQSMGSLSGDLIQTARGPSGQVYIFLADFTGHGLPAALGALPASSVFLAMAAKGLPVETIATELNAKLGELLPVGYFCCAVLAELCCDRRHLHLWNGGLPPVLVRRQGAAGYEKIHSHSVPLGVIGNDAFSAAAVHCELAEGDVLYAYTDGLTEAENVEGERWGTQRLEAFLQRPDVPGPKLPALIDAVLEHVNLAPPSDDISVVEIEPGPASRDCADAA